MPRLESKPHTGKGCCCWVDRHQKQRCMQNQRKKAPLYFFFYPSTKSTNIMVILSVEPRTPAML